MVKVCSTCGESKELEDFPKHKECVGGRKGVCKLCTYNQQKARARSTKDEVHKRYYKTPKGFIVRCYLNMTARVKGRVKPHLYQGLPILPKEDFYNWAMAPDSGFKELFDVWTQSGYDNKLCPSIDRKDSSEGYVIDNIRWITHSENSRLGGQHSPN